MQQKIKLLADKLEDYRVKDYLNPKEENIDKWLSQFTPKNQEIILDEMINIVDKLYITEQIVNDFLKGLVKNENLTGTNPTDFWGNVSLLNIQKNGNSQNKMVQKLVYYVKKELDINVSINCLEKPRLIYVDDFLFSGSKLYQDISNEFTNDSHGSIDIIYIGYYTYGKFNANKRLEENFPNITFKYLRIIELENRVHCINKSCVLWPTSDLASNTNIQNFLGKRHTQKFREPSSGISGYGCIEQDNLFTSENNRQILEKEFTLAGLTIINKAMEQRWDMSSWKPLGFSSFNNLGFGSMILSYRNCPNNAPLCLWWGNWNSNSIWYPLFQRNTYSS